MCVFCILEENLKGYRSQKLYSDLQFCSEKLGVPLKELSIRNPRKVPQNGKDVVVLLDYNLNVTGFITMGFPLKTNISELFYIVFCVRRDTIILFNS